MATNDFDWDNWNTFDAEDKRPAPRSELSFESSQPEPDPPGEPEPVDISGDDVWEALKEGCWAGFVIGLAAGVLSLFARQGDGGTDLDYFRIVFGCTVLMPVFWVPLALGAKLAAQSRGLGAGTIRLVYRLCFLVATLAALGVVGFMIVGKIFVATH